MACNKCGMCCRAFVLQFSMIELANELRARNGVKQPGDLGNVEHAVAHFKEITRLEAARRNPYVVGYIKKMEQIHRKAFTYECDLLGPDGLCKYHELRPDVCSGYPFYELTMPSWERKANFILYTPDCGYAPEVEADKAELMKKRDADTLMEENVREVAG